MLQPSDALLQGLALQQLQAEVQFEVLKNLSDDVILSHEGTFQQAFQVAEDLLEVDLLAGLDLHFVDVHHEGLDGVF